MTTRGGFMRPTGCVNLVGLDRAKTSSTVKFIAPRIIKPATHARSPAMTADDDASYAARMFARKLSMPERNVADCWLSASAETNT